MMTRLRGLRCPDATRAITEMDISAVFAFLQILEQSQEARLA